MTVDTRLGRATRLMLWAAGVWCVALVVASATVPFYRGETSSSSLSVGRPGTANPAPPPVVTTTRSSATLVQVNGLKALLLVAVPGIMVAVVAAALTVRRRRGRRGAGTVASVATATLCVGTVVGLLSIGPLVLPATVLAVLCCARAD